MAYSVLEAGDCPPAEVHNLPLSEQSVLQVLKEEVIPGLTGNLNKYFAESGKTLTFALGFVTGNSGRRDDNPLKAI